MSRTAILWPAGIVTMARTFSLVTSVPVGISTRAMTTSSSACRRMVRSAACSMALLLQWMAGHQLVGMHPPAVRADALEPGAYRPIIVPGDAELLGPVQITAQREIGDAEPAADRIALRGEMLVEDAERVFHAAAQEFGHRRLAALLELHQEAQRGDVARELVVVPQDPAQDLAPLVLAAPPETSESDRQIIEDHAGLRKALARVLEHRHFAHLIQR